MKERINVMDGWTDGRTNGRMHRGGKEGWMDGWMDGWGTSGVYMRPISSFISPFQATEIADNNFRPIMSHYRITD